MATVKKTKDIEVLKAQDAKPVTGRFIYKERPGQVLEFPYRKYKGEPIKVWKLRDGEVYTLPRGIAGHLQREGKYQVHAHALDEDGNPSMKIGHTIDRYTFESLSFLDEEDEGGPALYTAEIIPEKKVIKS